MKRFYQILFIFILSFGFATSSIAQKAGGNSGAQNNSPGCNVFIPNAFTPNGDNINDHFKLKYSDVCDITSYNLKIFDRWGRMVFEVKTSDPNFAWDGTFEGRDLQEGVFVWNLQITINPSQIGERDRIERHGTVALFR